MDKQSSVKKNSIPPRVLNKEAFVHKLIDDQNHCWKLNLLQQIFFPAEIHAITTIPISSVAREDKLVQSPTKNGLFSVRSAYHLQHSLSLNSRGAASTI